MERIKLPLEEDSRIKDPKDLERFKAELKQKPCRDWTLGELQKFCQNTKMCSQECPVVVLCDKFWDYIIPGDWKLPSTFTERDRNDAYKVREMFCRDGRLCRQGEILTFNGTVINNALFPGLADGEQTCLKEILEEEEEKK